MNKNEIETEIFSVIKLKPLLIEELVVKLLVKGIDRDTTWQTVKRLTEQKGSPFLFINHAMKLEVNECHAF